jgi:hypothetical protein
VITVSWSAVIETIEKIWITLKTYLFAKNSSAGAFYKKNYGRVNAKVWLHVMIYLCILYKKFTF